MPNTQIKICGLSTPETLDAAVDAGATHIGLVHYEPSSRHVSLEDAAKLRARVPAHVKVVLLLVSMQAPETAHALQAVKPDIVQFHGSETPEWLKVVKDSVPIGVWKAIGVRDASSLESALRFKDCVDMLLYDAPARALPGGNGLKMDWSLLAGHKHQKDWGLAGGLTPENVADAIAKTGAPLVDASTGIESAPGVKDIDKIKAFCQAVQSL